MSRWLARIALAALACTPGAAAGASADRVIVVSPGHATRIDLHVSGGLLFYEVRRGDLVAIEPSRTGILLDGIDIGAGVSIGAIENYAIDRANAARVTVIHQATGLRYGVELRAGEYAAAYRVIVPGSGRHVIDVVGAFTLPAGSIVPSQQPIGDVVAGEWAALPLTVRLPGGAGSIAITESEAGSYPAMTLQSAGNRVFRERLVAPKPPAMDGRITTPWRVIRILPS